ncbi:hypothetical protein ACFQGE_10745 [Halomicroarcula sp. GCM10025817]|uniref:DUF5789 family protein n=1 Tax=Haloarcula TaxID=2237 RepID=UPI0023E84D0E|nr:hypothetical protein [Halomicroarcula sp. SYNS111]
MTREIKLNELDALVETASFPLSKAAAREQFADVRIRYADGEESMGELLDRVPDEAFESVEDVRTSIFNVVPVAAVGEPGQSEGEG